jgi:protein subunit release factor A
MPIVEIHAAEGGEDAKLLTADLFSIYCKMARRRGL